jgi:hypothetical protein
MIQRILNSKNFMAFLLTSVTGMALYFQYPFPSDNLSARHAALEVFQSEGLFGVRGIA